MKKTRHYSSPAAKPVTVLLEEGLLVKSNLAGGGDITGEPIDWDEDIVLDGGDGSNAASYWE